MLAKVDTSKSRRTHHRRDAVRAAYLFIGAHCALGTESLLELVLNHLSSELLLVVDLKLDVERL